MESRKNLTGEELLKVAGGNVFFGGDELDSEKDYDTPICELAKTHPLLLAYQSTLEAVKVWELSIHQIMEQSGMDEAMIQMLLTTLEGTPKSQTDEPV